MNLQEEINKSVITAIDMMGELFDAIGKDEAVFIAEAYAQEKSWEYAQYLIADIRKNHTNKSAECPVGSDDAERLVFLGWWDENK